MCRMRDVEFGEASSSSSAPTQDRSSGPTQSLQVDDNDCSSSAAPPPPSSSSSSVPANDRRTNSRIRHGGASNGGASSSTTTPPPPRTTNKDEGFGSSLLDSLPPSQQMALVSFLMFLFFGMHNVLQEAIVNLLNIRASEASAATEEAGAGAATPPLASDRNWTIMLGYAEVVGVLAFSYLERVRLTTEGGTHRVAPLSAYPLLTFCLFASSSLSNLSLGYINFPTKVVFRSCKLVPTMFIATIVNSKRFRTYEYLCALSICAGLVLFAMADYSLDPLEFHPAGLLLVGGSVVADAVLPNAQERLFMDGSSRLEVTVYSNFFIFVGMTTATLANGTLPRFLGVVARDGTLALYFGTYAVLSYISISCYMTLVKRFGGVTAVVLTTARKAMTLVLSFVLFPKGFSWLYVHGSLLVLGAVMMASVCKKMGIGKGDGPSPSSRGGKGAGGEYISLAYGNDGRDLESRGVKKLRASAPSSSSSLSHGFSLEGSQLEKSAAAILEGISKRAYT